ncbi:MAG: insulinase family protein, partial [Pseudomonadota bacterium]|nr:insulinase family protein [Pseudomonadota bacterium]
MASIRIRRGAPCLATALACIWLPMAQAAPGDQDSPSSSAETATATTSIAAATSPIVSPHDDRDYRVLTLDNGLEVLLVSDPEADKAAASLNVSVGSAQDPDDLQGLAHLLEHMLFLGTEAYPEADAYQ